MTTRRRIGSGGVPAATRVLAYAMLAWLLAIGNGCSPDDEALPESPLAQRYATLRVIDAHNHGANASIDDTLHVQARYSVDATVLFGAISGPESVKDDAAALEAIGRHPDRVYPFFSGIPLREERGLAMAIDNLERGTFGIGEIVGASTQSPVASKAPWKASHPNDGILPQLYALSAQYRVPVLLHVDPPTGSPISQLEQALTANRDAVVVFGHGNAYNGPESLAALLGRHPNLYVDFFAGFTARNRESANTLLDFVPVIEAHRERFVVSTDSGYDVGLGPAIVAIYELLDLLTPEAACRVAYQNVEALMEQQPPTRAQADEIVRLSRRAGRSGAVRLNKRQAHALIRELRSASAAAVPSTDGLTVEPVTEYVPDAECAERVRRMRGQR